MSTIRKLGEGYEAIVDAVDGKLTYSLPVDSGFISAAFSFGIGQADLDVLLTDPYRRAVLETVAHTVLQRSMIRGNRKVSDADFADLVARVLHSPPAALAHYLAMIDSEHHICTSVYIEQTLARRAGGA